MTIKIIFDRYVRTMILVKEKHNKLILALLNLHLSFPLKSYFEFMKRGTYACVISKLKLMYQFRILHS